MSTSRVFIGGLPFGCREKDLERFCRDIGRIRNVLLKTGYAFVDFQDERDADDAVYELNGKTILGDRVTVEKAKGLPKSLGGSGGGGGDYRNGGGRSGGGFSPRYSRGGGGGWGDRGDFDRRGSGGRFGGTAPLRTEHRIIVENLTTRMSWQDLKDFMRKAGEVTYANAHNQKKNEGVVEFATRKEMLHALDTLDGQEINGRKIKLSEAVIPQRRSGGDGGSRYRSRSGSRSRSRSRRLSRSRSPLSHSRSKSGSRAGSKSKSRSRSRSGDEKNRKRSATPSDGENAD